MANTLGAPRSAQCPLLAQSGAINVRFLGNSGHHPRLFVSKISSTDNLNFQPLKFPVLAPGFPVLSKQFPVPLSREFASESL
jgi:hypothetical protein